MALEQQKSPITIILNNLYTNKKSDWIKSIQDSTIEPMIIQRFLLMNDRLLSQTRWLDKYVFILPKKMYLSLAWSIIPKVNSAPFVKYIKKIDQEDEFDFIISRIRKQYMLSDNDYKHLKKYIMKDLTDNMIDWFKYYGIEKKYWKKYSLKFKLMSENTDKQKRQTGLFG